jgi:hypothetical protein
MSTKAEQDAVRVNDENLVREVMKYGESEDRSREEVGTWRAQVEVWEKLYKYKDHDLSEQKSTYCTRLAGR